MAKRQIVAESFEFQRELQKESFDFNKLRILNKEKLDDMTDLRNPIFKLRDLVELKLCETEKGYSIDLVMPWWQSYYIQEFEKKDKEDAEQCFCIYASALRRRDCSLKIIDQLRARLVFIEN